MLDILQSQVGWKNKPKSFDWHFPALDAPSETEFADIKKKYAEIDAMYIDRGAIFASEAWQERFGSGEFQYNVKLSKAELDVESDEEENEADDDSEELKP